VAAAWGRLPGGAEARVSGSEKKNQALITMLEASNSTAIPILQLFLSSHLSIEASNSTAIPLLSPINRGIQFYSYSSPLTACTKSFNFQSQ
jgi:hypothetical protein